MEISIDEKRAEAIIRMKMLGIFPDTIQQFKKDGLVSISEPPMGAFFWAEGEDLERIRKFEESHNALVYVVIRSYTTIGKLDDFLFVSDYKEEWQMDREYIEKEHTLSYCFNHNSPFFSEMGYIRTEKTPAAGLRRKW